MKHAIFRFALVLALPVVLLAGCASSRNTQGPIDRTETERAYRIEEAKNQERSLTRSEIMSRISALQSQVKSIDAQIKNQKDLIEKWQGQEGVASAQAMVENAQVRIKHLQGERETLVKLREEFQADLSRL